LKLTIVHDKSWARFHGVAEEESLDFELATPLWKEHELRRVMMSRLERLSLQAPSMGLWLEVMAVVPAPAEQLDLSRVSSGTLVACPGEGALPVLLAELAADLGKSKVGILQCVERHRPESKSRLSSATASLRKKRIDFRPGSSAKEQGGILPRAPNRWLPKPLALEGAFRVGATHRIGSSLYTVEAFSFDHRLDGVEWWSQSKLSRDYLKLLLKGPYGVVEAVGFVERKSGARFLHAVWD
jgi:hypothetical protein